MAISSTLRALVLQRDKFRCWFCGLSSLETTLQVDHIIPRSRGGTDTLDNLATLCQKCNRGKSDKYFGDYIVLVKQGSLPRQTSRSALYPSLGYQQQALVQIIARLKQLGHTELPILDFMRVIPTIGRDGVSPEYEPLSFATLKEAFNAMLSSGEIIIKNDTVILPV